MVFIHYVIFGYKIPKAKIAQILLFFFDLDKDMLVIGSLTARSNINLILRDFGIWNTLNER